MTRVQGHGKNTQYAKKALNKAKPKTLADIKKPQIKAVRQQAAAQKAVAQNNQSVLSDLLAGTKKQTDLDAIRKEIGTYGTSAQRAELEKLNHQFKKEGQALLDDYLGNVTSKKELESLRTMVEANGSQAQRARFGQWESYFERPTWQKYADLHGTTYTPPTSGVAEVNRQAAKIIAENQARKPFIMADPAEAFGAGTAGGKVVTPPSGGALTPPVSNPIETATSQGWLSKLKDALTSPTAKKAYKWIGIGVGVAALGYLAYKGIKALTDKNEPTQDVQQSKPQVQPQPEEQKKPIQQQEVADTTLINNQTPKVQNHRKNVQKTVIAPNRELSEARAKVLTETRDSALIEANDSVTIKETPAVKTDTVRKGTHYATYEEYDKASRQGKIKAGDTFNRDGKCYEVKDVIREKYVINGSDTIRVE